MDTRLLKAGAVMALAMTLLIPTFNAVNNSYVEVTEYPSWLPPPDQLPENLRPPENMRIPDPPPDWTPPPDWKPPPGWENWTPPEGWKEKWGDRMPPAGMCPPPVWKHNLTNGNFTGDMNGASWSEDVVFTIPKYTIGFGFNVTVTDWSADRVSATIEPELQGWDTESAQGTRSTNPLATGGPQGEDQFWPFVWDPRDHGNALAPEGQYNAQLAAFMEQRAVPPIGGAEQLRGTWTTTLDLFVACGGAFG